MPTDTFSISAAANDGCGFRSGTTWATISSATFTAFDDDASNIIYADKYRSIPGGGVYEVANIFLRFDTSTIADDATVTGANLLLYVADLADSADDVEYAADFYDFGGEPSVAGDWEQSSSGDAISLIDPDSLTLNTVNTIALTGLAGINLTGFTGIRIAPNSTAEPTSGDDNWIGVAAQEHANQEPRLEVTYTVPAGEETQTSFFVRRRTMGRR